MDIRGRRSLEELCPGEGVDPTCSAPVLLNFCSLPTAPTMGGRPRLSALVPLKRPWLEVGSPNGNMGRDGCPVSVCFEINPPERTLNPDKRVGHSRRRQGGGKAEAEASMHLNSRHQYIERQAAAHAYLLVNHRPAEVNWRTLAPLAWGANFPSHVVYAERRLLRRTDSAIPSSDAPIKAQAVGGDGDNATPVGDSYVPRVDLAHGATLPIFALTTRLASSHVWRNPLRYCTPESLPVLTVRYTYPANRISNEPLSLNLVTQPSNFSSCDPSSFPASLLKLRPASRIPNPDYM
ncbi:hypothetical protein PLEOSDRAFT_169314 [Pleurotus ostreatus PC15]|uniref:Uncharacterized protein n=1 Tax=Pleurotus ostreatus (strain PC15) TaxID=1137138 RepID=A0A067NB20_PLEO1|nr:hypothetical protein PLEOSDRAFT_169314 [Pleurotus ostreatus PC15]